MADIFSQADPLLQDYQTKSKQAAEYTASGTTLPDLLKTALNEKFSGGPIVEERNRAATDFLSQSGNAPSTVTQEGTGGIILDPNQQSSLISSRRALALLPLLQANSRYDLMQGSLADTIGAAGRAYQAQGTLATSQAASAKDAYTMATDRIYKNASLAEKANKGSGSNLKELLSIYRLLKPTAGQAKDAYNANSGIRAIQKARTLLEKDPNVVWSRKSGITRFFSPDAQQFDAATREMTDVFTRLRTGAALNNQEIKIYEENKPQPGDSPETMDYKLSILEDLYSSVARKSDIPDLATFLNEGMGSLSPQSAGEWEVVSP